MHNSQSSDSAAGGDGPPVSAPDQRHPTISPPASPPNDAIPSPSANPAQVLPHSSSDQDHPSPTSSRTQLDNKTQPRPPDDPQESRPTTQPAAPSSSPSSQPKQQSIQPPNSTQNRRQQRTRGRPGRPPNINENSLMRRLECVMAVDSGRMTMNEACQHYDISARTFYRWLRNKERLIELTGFTEDDFKDGTPPVNKQTIEMHDSARMPAQRPEPDSNLPRLPTQPVVSGPESRPRDPNVMQSTVAPFQPPPFSKIKRRFPKAVDPSREYPPQWNERYVSQNPVCSRQGVTKILAQGQYSQESGAGPSQQQTAARNATRMRREYWHEQPGVEYVRNDARNCPVQYTGSPQHGYKRRKLLRVMIRDEGDGEPIMMTPSGEPHPNDESPAGEGPCVNGNPSQHREGDDRATLSREGALSDCGPHGKNVAMNGIRYALEQPLAEGRYLGRNPCKHRIEVMMGRRKVILAWYDGATAGDIKSCIARRFALLPDAQWALMDIEDDEVVISDSLPSGRYTLVVLS